MLTATAILVNVPNLLIFLIIAYMSHCCPYVGEDVHKRFHSVDNISPSAVEMLGLVGQYS